MNWKPKDIIINEKVKNDPVTINILEKCEGSTVCYVKSGLARDIIKASSVFDKAETMLDKILAGKQVLYIAPATDIVDIFTMPDDRMVCPHFDRLKLASNGCFYQCDWCYLKLTYRAAGYPVRLRLDPIVPFPGWKDAYALIKDIFAKIFLERITIGTLRFEEGFYNMRNRLLKPELSPYLDDMVPMFPPKLFPGTQNRKPANIALQKTKEPIYSDLLLARSGNIQSARLPYARNQQQYGKG